MKKQKSIIVILLTILLSHFGFGQNNFTNCSAAFLNSKMIVNEYSPSGKCTVSITEKGDLTVNTVQLSTTESKAIEPIMFQIAIRNKETGTLMLVSKEKIKKIEIEKVLEKCKKGDHIIVLTVNDEYALPHNEILVL
jgi:Zn finger protein HypA/HybF involved in hydrogenase expression